MRPPGGGAGSSIPGSSGNSRFAPRGPQRFGQGGGQQPAGANRFGNRGTGGYGTRTTEGGMGNPRFAPRGPQRFGQGGGQQPASHPPRWADKRLGGRPSRASTEGNNQNPFRAPRGPQRFGQGLGTENRGGFRRTRPRMGTGLNRANEEGY